VWEGPLSGYVSSLLPVTLAGINNELVLVKATKCKTRKMNNKNGKG
jgi:hypothetical protein